MSVDFKYHQRASEIPMSAARIENPISPSGLRSAKWIGRKFAIYARDGAKTGSRNRSNCSCPPHASGAHPAGTNREHRQNHERNGHFRAAFVHVMLKLRRHPRLAAEGHEEAAKHIKGGKARGEGRQPIKPGRAQRAVIGGGQNFIFAEEAGESGDAADGERGDQERPERGLSLWRRPPM